VTTAASRTRTAAGVAAFVAGILLASASRPAPTSSSETRERLEYLELVTGGAALTILYRSSSHSRPRDIPNPSDSCSTIPGAARVIVPARADAPRHRRLLMVRLPRRRRPAKAAKALSDGIRSATERLAQLLVSLQKSTVGPHARSYAASRRAACCRFAGRFAPDLVAWPFR